MQKILIFIAIGICFCFRGPNAHGASASTAAPSTMDSLETHIWIDKNPRTLAEQYDSVIFVLFLDNTMFTRRYTRQRGWWPLISAPFYFYTPGLENQTDIRVYYPDTIPMFRFDRIGQQKNGRFLVYDYSPYPYPRMADRQGEQQRVRLRREGLSPLARGISIVILNDTLIHLRGNSDFFPCVKSTTLHATTAPFPWDENLKYFDYPVKQEEQEEEQQEKAGKRRKKK